jgi:trimethylamine--corrinoid protein Co-methyltransferase
MDMGMVCSQEMLVMGNEVVGMAKRFLRGVEVTPETLARDVIANVGPAGHYLDDDHTYDHFRSHLWRPTLLDRRGRDDWELDGAKDMATRVKEATISIIENHQPEPLPDKTLAALAELREKGAEDLLNNE